MGWQGDPGCGKRRIVVVVAVSRKHGDESDRAPRPQAVTQPQAGGVRGTALQPQVRRDVTRVEVGVAGVERQPGAQHALHAELHALRGRVRDVAVVHRVRPQRRAAVLDQIPEPLVEVRDASGHGPAEPRVLEPRFPVERVLGFEVRIPVHEAGREVLVKTRLLEARADGRDRAHALSDPHGHARSMRSIGAEALIGLQPRSGRDAHQPLGSRDDLQIDRAVIPRSRGVERSAAHCLSLKRPSHGNDRTRDRP